MIRPPLKAGARRILDTIARHHPMRLSKAQVGTLAKFKTSGGTFASYKSALVTGGYIAIDNEGFWTATAEGLAAAGAAPGSPMTPLDVLEQWRSALKRGSRDMLDLLVDVYPTSLTLGEIAEKLNMAVTGGTFASYLSTLRTNGLIQVVGHDVAASDTTDAAIERR